MTIDADIHHMKSALAIAGRGVGRVWPNPSVGCIIVKRGVVIARARTADGGRPHAETIALEQAGAAAKGATLYVSLEPCTHHGQTPPCLDAIIDAGISRVVIGAIDVDKRVSGKATKLLEDANISVTQGILEGECNALNIGFIKRVTQNRPFITLKAACTIDGKIACSSGESKWITGELARRSVHQLRSRHDAILVGKGTVIADDPILTSRTSGLAHNIVRVILDSKLNTPADCNLVKSAKDHPLWLLHNCAAKDYGEDAVLHQVNCHDLNAVLKLLADQGVTRLLVEGGAKIHAAFLRENLCDELLLYRAPTIIGNEGISVVNDMNIKKLADRHDFTLSSVQAIGSDILETYKCSQD